MRYHVAVHFLSFLLQGLAYLQSRSAPHPLVCVCELVEITCGQTTQQWRYCTIHWGKYANIHNSTTEHTGNLFHRRQQMIHSNSTGVSQHTVNTTIARKYGKLLITCIGFALHMPQANVSSGGLDIRKGSLPDKMSSLLHHLLTVSVTRSTYGCICGTKTAAKVPQHSWSHSSSY